MTLTKQLSAMKDLKKKILWSYENNLTNYTHSLIFLSFQSCLGFGTKIETDSQLTISKNIIEIPENKLYNFCLLFYKAFSELSNFYPAEFDVKIVATKTHSIYLTLQQQSETSGWVKKCDWGLNIIKKEGQLETRVVFSEPALFEYMQETFAFHLLYTIGDKKKRLNIRDFLNKANLMNTQSQFKAFQIKKNIHNELTLLDSITSVDLSTTPLRNYINRNFLKDILKPKSYTCFRKHYFNKYLDLITCIGLTTLMKFEFYELCPYMQDIVYLYESRCTCCDCNP